MDNRITEQGQHRMYDAICEFCKVAHMCNKIHDSSFDDLQPT